MVFHQQLREFLKDHPDLTDLTDNDLEKFEKTCSSEEQDQRNTNQLPPLRHQSANSISSYELPPDNNQDNSASSVDFGGHSAEINFNLPPGEPNTASHNDRNLRSGKKSASVIDGNPAGKSVNFGNMDTKKHDGKKPKPRASDVPARKQWNKSIPKIAADFIRLLLVCIHTGGPRYKYDASVDNVQKDEH
jgi:hypothetical protein